MQTKLLTNVAETSAADFVLVESGSDVKKITPATLFDLIDGRTLTPPTFDGVDIAWQDYSGGYTQVGNWIYVYAVFHSLNFQAASNDLKLAAGFPNSMSAMAALTIAGTPWAKWSTAYVDGNGILRGKLDTDTIGTNEYWVCVTGIYRRA